MVRRRLGTAAVVLVVLATAGCGDDDPETGEGPDPSPPASSPGQSPGQSPSQSPGSPTSDPTAPSDPAVSPADGPLLALDHVSVRVPDTFREEPPSNLLLVAEDPRTGVFIALSDTLQIGRPYSLDEQARARVRSALTIEPPEIQEPVTVAGEPMYHLSGPFERGSRMDEYGVALPAANIFIRFVTPDDLPEAQRQELIDSVLATLTLT